MAGYANFQVTRNKSYKGINIFKKNRNINKNGEIITKSEKLMNGIAIWGSFYRSNPHRFVKEYLQINLKVFQQILLYMMNYSNYFMYLASRGQGKTWLTAVYCITRAILWADTKIVISSGTKSQSKEVIEKIEDLRKNSPNLQREISNISTSTNDPLVEFHNGSWIKTVASNDNARSKRANLLIVDEFRMVDLSVITKVLRKFLTAPRQPKYLDKPEYKHLQERNKEIYLSSCWYKHHWSWNRLLTYFKSMIDLKKYFICGLPYQLAIKENLLMRDQVLDEMAEDDFDETAWLMEMECLFFGESEKAYYKFDELQSNRVLSQAIYPKNYYNLLKDKSFNYTPKKDEEIRIISCDIAGMAGKQNDASVYTIFRLIPNKKGYERHIIYMESMNGGHTVIQATRIRQLFDDFDCNYLVLDTQNMGLGIYDQLCNNLFDKERKIEYEAWTCINDEKMAERCLVPNSPKKIYSVKGNSQFNSECAILLKDNLKRNKIKLLVDETEGRNYLTQLKGFMTLPLEEQVKFEAVYKQITAFVNEMVNLENEGKDGIVKLKEPSNQRKDRYSSVTYGNFFASELEREYLRTKEQSQDFSQFQIIPEGGSWEESSTYSF